MMAATLPNLQELRRRLDAIDDGLHDLLIDRAEIVALVADHKRNNHLTFYQPEREAEIIRRLVARHHGRLPLASLIRIWREMLAATVSLETPFSVAVYAPTGSPGFWDLARDHYGSHTPITAYGSIAQVIRAVAEAPESAGVLPMPQEGEPDPWWHHLLSQDRNTPRVVARLPFGARGNARAAGADALVIGHGAQRDTGGDRTLIATETAEISRARILGLLAALDLNCTLFASSEHGDGAVDLIELDGFVPLSDPRIEAFRTQLGSALHRLLALGGYAVPLPIGPPSPALPAVASAASWAARGCTK
jgi:chorismate mutase / prephenate dehydratase